MKINILKSIIIFILCISFFAFAKKDESLEMEDMSHESHMPEEEFLKIMKSFNVTNKEEYLKVYIELSSHGLPPLSQLSKMYPNWLGFEEESSKNKIDVKWVENQLKSIELSESLGYELNELSETPDAEKQLKKPKNSKTLEAKTNGRKKEKIKRHNYEDFVDYEGFIDFIRHHSISKSEQYYDLRKKNPIFKGKKLPGDPKNFYKNWLGWNVAFDKGEHMNFEEIKDFILKKKIRSRRQYIKIRKENHIVNGKILPYNPNLIYEEWTSWGDILFSFEDASIEDIKDFVAQKNIQTVEQYRAERKKEPIFNGKYLSSTPERIHKSEWPSWNNILIKPEHMNFEELKDFILKKNIQSSKQYYKIRSKNPKFNGKVLPYNPNTFYEEWTVWGDILCEKTFKKTKKK